jgi:hypothetical protein
MPSGCGCSPSLSSQSFAVQANLAPLIDAVERRVGMADPTLGQIATIARMVSDFREAASATIIPQAAASVRTVR